MFFATSCNSRWCEAYSLWSRQPTDLFEIQIQTGEQKMASLWKPMALAILAGTVVAGHADRVRAQDRSGFQIPVRQVMQSLVTRQTSNTATQAVRTANHIEKQSSIGLTNGGLTFGGSKSSVAISVAPGGVGVAVGTDDTAVAVAVGGGGVGVGVANDKGTAVSVGAGSGGVSVGVDRSEPQYQLLGSSSSGMQQNSSGVNSPSLLGTAKTAGFGRASANRFTGNAAHWSFVRN